jgi:hypothetical protein
LLSLAGTVAENAFGGSALFPEAIDEFMVRMRRAKSLYQLQLGEGD